MPQFWQRDATVAPQDRKIGFSFVRQLPVRTTLNAQPPTLQFLLLYYTSYFHRMQEKFQKYPKIFPIEESPQSDLTPPP